MITVLLIGFTRVYLSFLQVPQVRQGTVLMEFGKFCSMKVAINSLPALRTASGETRRRTQYSWPAERGCGWCRKTHPMDQLRLPDGLQLKKTYHIRFILIYKDGNSMAVHSPGRLLTTACRTSSPSARASGASPHPGR